MKMQTRSRSVAIVMSMVSVSVVVTLAACVGQIDDAWAIDASNDNEPLVIRVTTGDTVSSWLLSRGKGATLFYERAPRIGQILLMHPTTCEVFDQMPIPSDTGVLMVSERADLSGYDLVFAPDLPPTSTIPDAPNFEGCRT